MPTQCWTEPRGEPDGCELDTFTRRPRLQTADGAEGWEVGQAENDYHPDPTRGVQITHRWL